MRQISDPLPAAICSLQNFAILTKDVTAAGARKVIMNLRAPFLPSLKGSGFRVQGFRIEGIGWNKNEKRLTVHIIDPQGGFAAFFTHRHRHCFAVQQSTGRAASPPDFFLTPFLTNVWTVFLILGLGQNLLGLGY